MKLINLSLFCMEYLGIFSKLLKSDNLAFFIKIRCQNKIKMENVNAIIGCRKFPNFRLVPVVYFLNVLRFYKSKHIDLHVSSKFKSYLVEKLSSVRCKKMTILKIIKSFIQNWRIAELNSRFVSKFHKKESEKDKLAIIVFK